MTRAGHRIQSVAVLAGIGANVLVCLAWATGWLKVGQVGPMFTVIALAMVFVTAWSTPMVRAPERDDEC
ncbi:hypothetical protein [Brevundimonas sp.]